MSKKKAKGVENIYDLESDVAEFERKHGRIKYADGVVEKYFPKCSAVDNSIKDKEPTKNKRASRRRNNKRQR